jgi:calpain-15
MATVTKEIAKGIFLHKRQMEAQGNSEGYEFIYMFSVDVKSLQILDFSADFNGSDNLVMEGSSSLVSNKTIQPMSNETVAILKLKRNWKLKSRFKFTMRNPPLDVQRKYLMPQILELNKLIEASDKHISNYPYDIMSTEALENQLGLSGTTFVDIDFPPIDSSVYNDINETPFDVLIHWRKPHEFMTVDYHQGLLEPSIFYESIEPNDIRQGSLGNAWFLSALATLAERPALIERLFITKEVNEQGVYKLRLCKNGEWVTVTVDDFFP